MTRVPSHVLAKARRVRVLALDVDGVLTDGSLHYGADGEALKTFHVHDGLGMRLAREHGLEVAIITARRGAALERRAADLGIEHIFTGWHNKRAALAVLCERLDVQPINVAFVGDDWVDLPLLRQVGLAIAVADAQPKVRAEVDWVTSQAGGRGAVREVTDALLEAQHGLESVCESFVRSCDQEASIYPGGELQ